MNSRSRGDREVVGAAALLAEFNAAGVLGPVDVHTATRLGQLCGETDESVHLAAALTVWALRRGSVCVDLQTIPDLVYADQDLVDDSADHLAELTWPEPTAWRAAVTNSSMITVGAEAPAERPLRLVDGLLYLERHWREQESVREQLQARRNLQPRFDQELLTAGLNRLFGAQPVGEVDWQRVAAAASVTNQVVIIAGGPGTGKTTTVARLLALLAEQHPTWRIALTAPTAKAAARLADSVAEAAKTLNPQDAARIAELPASTLHKLLGSSFSRFTHDAWNPLPHEVIVVDEMSMVSLPMMAQLLEAARPEARLILVGDPDQLSSVDAGVVLADIVSAELPEVPVRVAQLQALDLPGADSPAAHGVIRLRRNYRFGREISELAAAVRRGDADAAVGWLTDADNSEQIEFIQLDLDTLGNPARAEELMPVRTAVITAGRSVWERASAGDAPGALAGLAAHRLLVAHRSGRYGLAHWSRLIEDWVSAAIPDYGADQHLGSGWYVGRPIMIEQNDPSTGLNNSDTGVAIRTPAGLRCAFPKGAEIVYFAPVRLDRYSTLHASTIHKAQGSQFREVTLILPPSSSPLLTRELVYTAITRAETRVRIVGTLAAFQHAVARPANRASGLSQRLSTSPNQ